MLKCRCSSPSPRDSKVVGKLRLKEFKVVVIGVAACRHLILGEAVRESCVSHSADYAV
jgi:hypothetical protein